MGTLCLLLEMVGVVERAGVGVGGRVGVVWT